MGYISFGGRLVRRSGKQTWIAVWQEFLMPSWDRRWQSNTTRMKNMKDHPLARKMNGLSESSAAIDYNWSLGLVHSSSRETINHKAYENLNKNPSTTDIVSWISNARYKVIHTWCQINHTLKNHTCWCVRSSTGCLRNMGGRHRAYLVGKVGVNH